MACRHEGENDNCEQVCAELYGEILMGLPPSRTTRRSYKDLTYPELKRLRYEERMKLPGFAEMQQRTAEEEAKRNPDPFKGL